mgnify:CR=1 FL=1
MNERKMFPAKAEVLCIVFTHFGSYYAVHSPITFVGELLSIPHAVPRGSLDNGTYASPRKVDVDRGWVVEYLPKGLIIEMRGKPTSSE